MRAAVVVIAMLGVLAGEGRAQDQDLAGCYAFRPYQWSKSVDAAAARFHSPPDTFRLYLERGPEPPEHENMYEAGRPLVRPRLDALGRRGMSESGAFWMNWKADSVRITWTNGVEGAWVAARPEDTVLTGRLHWAQDALGPEPYPSAEVVIDRVACPTWLPDAPQSSRRDSSAPVGEWPRKGTELPITTSCRLRSLRSLRRAQRAERAPRRQL